MTRLEFLPQAERDLETIGDYIAKDSPRKAISFVRELRAQCVKITRSPQGYRRRTDRGVRTAQGIQYHDVDQGRPGCVLLHRQGRGRVHVAHAA